VKEALFNIVAGDILDSNWWDVFAGTGAVGIEALSRGAAFARFSDANRLPIETIRFNVEHCGFKSQAEIRRADAFDYLSSTPDRTFEYIYIAPPQYQDMWAKALELLDDNIAWLSADGWVIVQIHPKEYQALALQNLEEFDQRRYGTTLLVFCERKKP
jgi:16S rRNA (guanine(966)-N(2))-methyltransferase RsmD